MNTAWRIVSGIAGVIVALFLILFLVWATDSMLDLGIFGSNDNSAVSVNPIPMASSAPADGTGHGNEVAKGPQGDSFNPIPFGDGPQSCSPNETCIWDVGIMGDHYNPALGRNVTQVGIVKGVSISWNGKTADPSPNGRCSLIVLQPDNWFENLTLRDAHLSIYDIWEGDVAGWTKTLAVQAAQEQTGDYGCPQKDYSQIEQWSSGKVSPPCTVQGFNNCGTAQPSSQSGNQPTPVPAAQQPQAQQPAPAPAPAPACDTLDCGTRTATADTGGTASFNSGDAVYGYHIMVGGTQYTNCYFAHAPGSGTVTDGVIHPWTAEIANAKTC